MSLAIQAQGSPEAIGRGCLTTPEQGGMTRWWPVLMIVLPGGCLLALLAVWHRRRVEDQRTDLVPRWAAFIEGEPRIPPAKVPPLKKPAGRVEHELLRLLKRRA